MARPVRLSYKAQGEIMRSASVRAELHRRATQIAARARQLAHAEGLDRFGASITVEDGTRPRGRPYSRVIAHDQADHEWGSYTVGRSRVLGRAVDAGR